MISAFKSYWKNYFNFKDRTSRKDFWLTFLMLLIVSVVIGIVVGIITGIAGKEMVQLAPDGSNIGEYIKNPVIIVSLIWGLINLIPGIAIEVRRLHDVNFSGWFYLISLIPYVGGIILLVFHLLPTKPGAERFGQQV